VTPSPWVLDIVGIVVGAAVVYLFYDAVRTRWPANYASSSNDFGMIVNRTMLRYAAFALGPPYIVALLASTTVGRAGGSGMLVAILIGVFQVSHFRARLAYRTLRYDHSAMRIPTVVAEAGLAICTLGVVALGGLGPGPLGFVVPPIDELFKALWGTTFVIIVAAIVIKRTNVQLDIGRLVERSRQEIGPRLRGFAANEAVKAGADTALMEAILLTENLQRPAWFRRLERIKGRLFPRGSYGVMQVSADRPLSDEDSIVRAVAEHLHGLTIVKDNRGYPNYQSVQTTLARYNTDKAFLDLAMKIFWRVYDYDATGSRQGAPDVASHTRKAEPESSVEHGKADVETKTEVAATADVASGSKESADLLAQSARLCTLATLSLSTATVEELIQLNQAIGAFLLGQVKRRKADRP
jgi:hypothetical protein